MSHLAGQRVDPEGGGERYEAPPVDGGNCRSAGAPDGAAQSARHARHARPLPGRGQQHAAHETHEQR